VVALPTVVVETLLEGAPEYGVPFLVLQGIPVYGDPAVLRLMSPTFTSLKKKATHEKISVPDPSIINKK
jgi:hypothetical protein